MLADLQSLEPGEHRIACPACRRGPKDKTLGVTIQYDGGAVAHCFRCSYAESFRPDRPPTIRPVAAPKRETLSEYGVEFFAACTGLRATIGEQYLLARGCAIPPPDGDLRFHPALRHPVSDYTGPALIAMVTHAVTRAPLTLHRSWIRADGRKASVDPSRMLLAGHSKRHGVIRLWPDESVTLGLCIAEGVETALSAAHAFVPTWACVDAGNLATFPVLDGIESLTIAADNDQVGVGAAHECARRWSAAGREVRIAMASTNGVDLNDLVQETAT